MICDPPEAGVDRRSVEESAVDMCDAKEGHRRAVRQRDHGASATDIGCRHYIGDGPGILAREGDPVAMRLVEAHDGILPSYPAVLYQGTPGPGEDLIVAGPAIDRVGPAATKDRVVTSAERDLIRAGAAMDQCLPVAAIDCIWACAAIDRVVAVAAIDCIWACAAIDRVVAVPAKDQV